MNFNNIVARKDNRLFPVFVNKHNGDSVEPQRFSRDSKQLDQQAVNTSRQRQHSHAVMQLPAANFGIIIKLIETPQQKC